MDAELFELYRSVYRLTKWDSDILKHHLDGNIYDRRLFMSDVVADKDSYHPLYTSDYTLDRLKDFRDIRIDLWTGGHVVLKYQRHNGIPEKVERKYGDTIKIEEVSLLKALLKLVIALHEAKKLS